MLGKKSPNPVISSSGDCVPRKGWICSTGVTFLEVRNVSCDKQAPTGKGFVCL